MVQESKKIRVVIADRDVFFSQKLKHCLERRGDMTVVGVTDNGPEALRIIVQTNPDVLLLDALLGECDGVWVLENIKQQQIDCVSIMISAIDNDTIVRQAIAMGAAYYMVKPIQGDLLLERIHQMMQKPKQYEVSENNIVDIMERPMVEAHRGNSLEAEISALISRMGIPASIKGYHFIREAVAMAVQDSEVMIGITKGLYPDIAKMYHTTASKVERAIRHAIENAWKKNGKSIYFEISGYLMEDKPTNGQFIAILAEYFRMQRSTELPHSYTKATQASKINQKNENLALALL